MILTTACVIIWDIMFCVCVRVKGRVSFSTAINYIFIQNLYTWTQTRWIGFELFILRNVHHVLCWYFYLMEVTSEVELILQSEIQWCFPKVIIGLNRHLHGCCSAELQKYQCVLAQHFSHPLSSLSLFSVFRTVSSQDKTSTKSFRLIIQLHKHIFKQRKS